MNGFLTLSYRRGLEQRLFNGPFYEGLGCTEDPHPIMIERRQVERAVGLDQFGARVVMWLAL